MVLLYNVSGLFFIGSDIFPSSLDVIIDSTSRILEFGNTIFQ